MTDRYTGFAVVLVTPMRDDDAEATLAALRQIRGVATVEPIIDEGSDTFAVMRRDQEWIDRLSTLCRGMR